MAYKFRGKRFDCGSIEGFVEATNHVFENVYLKEKTEQEQNKRKK
jgi:UTP--glucose-1-phosphate uridylyltransferase